MKRVLIILVLGIVFIGVLLFAHSYIYNDYIFYINNNEVSIIKYIGHSTDIIKIPENIKGKNVTKIWKNAFKNNSKIKEVYIPSNVVEIGETAFIGCKNIEFVKILGNEPKVYSNTFNQKTVIKYSYGEEKYNDSVWKNFVLSEYNIPADMLTIEDIPDCVYSNIAIEPDIVITYKGNKLTKNDYEITHVDNINSGKAKLIIKLKGDYIGNVEKEFNIVSKEISKLSFNSLSDSNYTGKNITKEIKVMDEKYTLAEGTDYTVTYKNNKNVGTATVIIKGIGNYKGTKKFTFKINAVNISNVKISGIKSMRIYW